MYRLWDVPDIRLRHKELNAQRRPFGLFCLTGLLTMDIVEM
jgi:hypothetical protein